PKSNGNYNNINYPYESYLDLSIHPSYRLPVNETDRRAVLAELRENIDYPHLAARYGPDEVDELLELLTDTLCGTRPTIRVGSEEISAAAVKDRFWRLERHHMEYVLDRMRENTTKIHNIRGYLLTALYNAPVTLGHFFQAEVQHVKANASQA